MFSDMHEEWEYRLVEKTKKEIAREIIIAIKEIIDTAGHVIDNDVYVWKPTVGYDKKEVDKGLEKLAKEYGVEIKE